jgi:hypothetical protein
VIKNGQVFFFDLNLDFNFVFAKSTKVEQKYQMLVSFGAGVMSGRLLSVARRKCNRSSVGGLFRNL